MYAPAWCIMVHMPKKSERVAGTTRASVSFPNEVYAELERLAIAKKVSLAWVVREAAERYVAEHWPLFAQERRSESP
jgi:metal-responsive CopG/Arc/MetJ family transcriptional regulator